MIIGLTGTLASGKGKFAEFLKKKGFVYLSLSDELREVVKERKIELTRDNLQRTGNELRGKKGAEALAKLVFEKIKNQGYKKAVIDGIRNPAEIDFLKNNIKNFFLVSIDAPKELRFKRMAERSRESDPIKWNDFLKIDKKDRGVGEKKTGQGVEKCMKKAKIRIINDCGVEELENKFEKAYSDLNSKISPPSWDEYFMTFAEVASSKSKDPSTKVGACIVDREKRVVGLGYNGFPKYLDDNKFPFKREGNYLETKYPYVVHAEPNAILNSTKDTHNCIMYITLFPCNECAKLIIQSGIKEIVYKEDKYSKSDSVKAAKKLFREAGIKTRAFSPKQV